MVFRGYSLDPEGHPSPWASSFLLLSELAAKQWSIGNVSTSNKECLQGRRIVREDEEEEKEIAIKQKMEVRKVRRLFMHLQHL